LDDFFAKIEEILAETAARFGADLAATQGAPARTAQPIR
jgi:hypothetical protein